MVVTYIAAPDVSAVPERMPSPFATEPHPLARRAAEVVKAQLAGGLAHELGLHEDGKMFGVLVVRDDAGRIGFLRAFSGMVRGRWEWPGFVGPVFDLEARDAFWPAGECELARLGADIHAVDEEMGPLRRRLDELIERQRADLAEMRNRHADNRARRHIERERLSSTCTCTCTCTCHVNVHDQKHALDQQSRADTAERRRLDMHHRDERRQLEELLAPLDAKRRAVDEDRSAKSRGFLERIHATYLLPNARGQLRGLADIFAPAIAPGGAGDCAAPKLLAHAYRHQLRPLALTEFWCGAPPATGGRVDGHYYPACRGKCGVLLPYMLDGLDVVPAPVFGDAPIAASEPRTIFEDDWLAIVDKPAGLLSVPGRGTLTDCVQTRLRARYPTATGPLVVHRLDLDTSGVLVIAKDLATHAALQRLFSERMVDKRYIAWLDGEVRGEHGTIELPLRVDLDDRPRQIVDGEYGRPALTEWQVLERTGGRTRVALSPKTGRAHQLRVHAAHPRGLGVPIVGDRLYGRVDTRLLLHAEAIGFVHPHTHAHRVWHSPSPF
jgi:tRNA pseudouridine32 synthase/23S rRNA pseudouridine746 synthase